MENSNGDWNPSDDWYLSNYDSLYFVQKTMNQWLLLVVSWLLHSPPAAAQSTGHTLSQQQRAVVFHADQHQLLSGCSLQQPTNLIAANSQGLNALSRGDT